MNIRNQNLQYQLLANLIENQEQIDKDKFQNNEIFEHKQEFLQNEDKLRQFLSNKNNFHQKVNDYFYDSLYNQNDGVFLQKQYYEEELLLKNDLQCFLCEEPHSLILSQQENQPANKYLAHNLCDHYYSDFQILQDIYQADYKNIQKIQFFIESLASQNDYDEQNQKQAKIALNLIDFQNGSSRQQMSLNQLKNINQQLYLTDRNINKNLIDNLKQTKQCTYFDNFLQMNPNHDLSRNNEFLKELNLEDYNPFLMDFMNLHELRQEISEIKSSDYNEKTTIGNKYWFDNLITLQNQCINQSEQINNSEVNQADKEIQKILGFFTNNYEAQLIENEEDDLNYQQKLKIALRTWLNHSILQKFILTKYILREPISQNSEISDYFLQDPLETYQNLGFQSTNVIYNDLISYLYHIIRQSSSNYNDPAKKQQLNAIVSRYKNTNFKLNQIYLVSFLNFQQQTLQSFGQNIKFDQKILENKLEKIAQSLQGFEQQDQFDMALYQLEFFRENIDNSKDQFIHSLEETYLYLYKNCDNKQMLIDFFENLKNKQELDKAFQHCGNQNQNLQILHQFLTLMQALHKCYEEHEQRDTIINNALKNYNKFYDDIRILINQGHEYINLENNQIQISLSEQIIQRVEQEVEDIKNVYDDISVTKFQDVFSEEIKKGDLFKN
ncbi:hypothetical protein PPERSA_09068 [Pseudocohnilembus persalinus]|uniref:Uncharacterized protein n=1 Tax=Pseudocohnilembus persalinus TaxID=266149 RepID=A0A0V0QL32_PSEPJ|nr:hypothetical protein PPERSA_09068 [Pseudocohnilembus persalinus]|eukprot:KRX02946.1 hypothetical protein PPERSA_09068 [Pseudocohnilembus persalinus]